MIVHKVKTLHLGSQRLLERNCSVLSHMHHLSVGRWQKVSRGDTLRVWHSARGRSEEKSKAVTIEEHQAGALVFA